LAYLVPIMSVNHLGQPFLALALGVAAAFSAAAAMAAPSATIQTCFAPEADCAALAVRAIDRAEHEILVGAYGLTTGAGIVEALLRAHRRGVDVKLTKPHLAGATAGSTRWRMRVCPCGSITWRGSPTRRQWSSTTR